MKTQKSILKQFARHYISEFPYTKNNSEARSKAKKLGKGTWLKIRFEPILASLLALTLIGCVSATATRTGKDGSTSSIKVTGFLENVAGGTYTSTNSDGTSTTLAVANATPDQQSISILAGSVADIAKSAMLLARQPTNTVSVATNSAGNIIVAPTKP